MARLQQPGYQMGRGRTPQPNLTAHLAPRGGGRSARPTLRVLLDGGREITLSYPTRDISLMPVRDIKGILVHHAAIPVANQVLAFRGRELRDVDVPQEVGYNPFNKEHFINLTDTRAAPPVAAAPPVPAAPEPVTIFFTRDGKEDELSLSSHTMDLRKAQVEILKRGLQANFGIPVEDQVLSYKGRELGNMETIESVGAAHPLLLTLRSAPIPPVDDMGHVVAVGVKPGPLEVMFYPPSRAPYKLDLSGQGDLRSLTVPALLKILGSITRVPTDRLVLKLKNERLTDDYPLQSIPQDATLHLQAVQPTPVASDRTPSEPEPGNALLVVNHLKGGEEYTIAAGQNLRVLKAAHLKASLQREVGLPPEKLVISFNGRELREDETCEEAGVGIDEPIHLSLRGLPIPTPKKRIRIYVRVEETGKLVTVDSETIELHTMWSLKTSLAKPSGIPPAEQVLFFEGRELGDHEFCGEVGLGEGAVVLLSRRTRHTSSAQGAVPKKGETNEGTLQSALAFRAKCHNFLTYYAPEKLDDPQWLDRVLLEWADRPNAFWRHLVAEYGPWPPFKNQHVAGRPRRFSCPDARQRHRLAKASETCSPNPWLALGFRLGLWEGLERSLASAEARHSRALRLHMPHGRRRRARSLPLFPTDLPLDKRPKSIGFRVPALLVLPDSVKHRCSRHHITVRPVQALPKHGLVAGGTAQPGSRSRKVSVRSPRRQTQGQTGTQTGTQKGSGAEEPPGAPPHAWYCKGGVEEGKDATCHMARATHIMTSPTAKHPAESKRTPPPSSSSSSSSSSSLFAAQQGPPQPAAAQPPPDVDWLTLAHLVDETRKVNQQLYTARGTRADVPRIGGTTGSPLRSREAQRAAALHKSLSSAKAPPLAPMPRGESRQRPAPQVQPYEYQPDPLPKTSQEMVDKLTMLEDFLEFRARLPSKSAPDAS